MAAIDVRGGFCSGCGGPLVTLPTVTFLLCLGCGGIRKTRELAATR